jgi:hypothetical protein
MKEKKCPTTLKNCSDLCGLGRCFQSTLAGAATKTTPAKIAMQVLDKLKRRMAVELRGSRVSQREAEVGPNGGGLESFPGIGVIRYRSSHVTSLSRSLDYWAQW